MRKFINKILCIKEINTTIDYTDPMSCKSALRSFGCSPEEAERFVKNNIVPRSIK